jgi:hypothetical protein
MLIETTGHIMGASTFAAYSKSINSPVLALQR